MSGKFVKGAWVEDHSELIDCVNKCLKNFELTKEKGRHYYIRKDLDDQITDHQQQMYDTGVRVRKAGFMARLKYLFTRKI
jgi:hypothetical protein